VLDELGCSSDTRPVLVPLHQNLRRLPSRLHLDQTEQSDKYNFMAPHAVQVGSKRKRVANGSASNENVAHYTRASTRSKRRRADNLPTTRKRDYVTTTDEDEDVGEGGGDNVDEDEPSGMDVDTGTNRRSPSSSDSSEPRSDQEQTVDDDGDYDSELTPGCDDEDDSSKFFHNIAYLIN